MKPEGKYRMSKSRKVVVTKNDFGTKMVNLEAEFHDEFIIKLNGTN